MAPVSAVAWIEWARAALGDLDDAALPIEDPCGDVLAHVGRYLEQWVPSPVAPDEALRWSTEIDPDDLEYLVYAFYTLEVERGEGDGIPDEGRGFYLVFVRALLHALEEVSPSRAAFAEQLRSSWPSAAEAS